MGTCFENFDGGERHAERWEMGDGRLKLCGLAVEQIENEHLTMEPLQLDRPKL